MAAKFNIYHETELSDLLETISDSLETFGLTIKSVKQPDGEFGDFLTYEIVVMN
jgi:hypothetical protein